METSPRCTSAECDFQVVSQSRGIRVWLSPEPRTRGWWMWRWTYRSRKGGVALGHLKAPWASCWPSGTSVSPLVPAGTPQGIPNTLSWSYLGKCFEPLTANLGLWLPPPHVLCQQTSYWGGYILVREILIDLSLLLYSVFLFFQEVEQAWASSISRLEDQ